MKTFTLMKGRTLSFIILALFWASQSSAQTVSASPPNILRPIGANTVTVTITRSNGNWPGSGNYTWSVSNTTGISSPAAGSWPLSKGTGSGANASQAVTFTSAANGTYVFTVTRGGSSASVTVTICNIIASVAPDSTNGNRGEWVGGFLTAGATLNGAANGQKNFYDNGLTERASAIAVNTGGFIYYIENISSNGGSITVSRNNANGTGFVANATSGDLTPGIATNLGYVRLGIDPLGTGWILAASSTNIFLAKFTTNNSTGAAGPITLVSSNVPLTGAGAGTVADFQNGDICLAGNGRMLVLANDGSGTTQIYSMNPNAVTPTLAFKFNVNGSGPAPFTGSVNGVAFDATGNLYMSSTNDGAGVSGLYFIPQGTVNTGSGTVNATNVWSGDGLTDLGSNLWPNTIILPVKFESFTVAKQANNALLNWATSSESEAGHYEIESSTDGVNFVAKGSVGASGSSSATRNYQFTDPIPAGSSILYYRLKIVEMDGSFSYSKIVSLRVKDIVIKGFNVYPNPFTTSLKIELKSVSESSITVRLSNAMGQAVLSRQFTLQPGENVVVLSSELEALKTGMYVMEIVTGEGKLTQKIIKR